MSAIVTDFLLNALHTFQVRTLASLGFGTRVSLSNKSGQKAKFKTDYRVDLTVYESGFVAARHVGVAHLGDGEMISLDCAQWSSKEAPQRDQIMFFHLIPERLLGQVSESGTISVSREEMWYLFTAQDQYVEYFRDDGFASGVLYQSGAFNYPKFSAEASTLIQAPKVCISPVINTYVSLIHTSVLPSYDRVGDLKCALVDEVGHKVASWTAHVRPFEPMLLNLKEIVAEKIGAAAFAGVTPSFFTFYALSSNATLLPLILNTNEEHHTLAVEHSLPPTYYGASMTGANRALAIKELAESTLFHSGEN